MIVENSNQNAAVTKSNSIPISFLKLSARYCIVFHHIFFFFSIPKTYATQFCRRVYHFSSREDNAWSIRVESRQSFRYDFTVPTQEPFYLLNAPSAVGGCTWDDTCSLYMHMPRAVHAGWEDTWPHRVCSVSVTSGCMEDHDHLGRTRRPFLQHESAFSAVLLTRVKRVYNYSQSVFVSGTSFMVKGTELEWKLICCMIVTSSRIPCHLRAFWGVSPQAIEIFFVFFIYGWRHLHFIVTSEELLASLCLSLQ